MSFRTKFVLILLSATLTVYTLLSGWISMGAQQPANDPEVPSYASSKACCSTFRTIT